MMFDIEQAKKEEEYDTEEGLLATKTVCINHEIDLDNKANFDAVADTLRHLWMDMLPFDTYDPYCKANLIRDLECKMLSTPEDRKGNRHKHIQFQLYGLKLPNDL